MKKRVKKEEIDKETANDYISAIDRNLTNVMHPDELEELILNVQER